ncbi:hypothetical protein ACOMHN_054024 [Nucella lapillus]
MRTQCLILGAMTCVVTLTLVLTPPETDDKSFRFARSGNETKRGGGTKSKRGDNATATLASCATYANGCSIPVIFINAFEADMIQVLTPSCNNHDMCYHCGAVFKTSRSQCDRTFLHEMHALCDALTPSQISASRSRQESVRVCKTTARIFYLAVAIFAASSYVDSDLTAPEFCSSVAHCVSGVKMVN